MWIRSQNRKCLLNLNGYSIYKEKDLYQIIGFDVRNSNYDIDWVLGEYSKKEKALKVLDMIQGCITGNVLQSYEIARDCPLAGIEFNGVFNMPQDDEV